jgi:hypothetical protein
MQSHFPTSGANHEDCNFCKVLQTDMGSNPRMRKEDVNRLEFKKID